jgi:hypothetical protein
MKFESRPEARDWCKTHYPGSPLTEIGPGGKRAAKKKGMQISYKSAEKYVGDDALDLLILYPGGTAWEVHYDVSVR